MCYRNGSMVSTFRHLSLRTQEICIGFFRWFSSSVYLCINIYICVCIELIIYWLVHNFVNRLLEHLLPDENTDCHVAENMKFAFACDQTLPPRGGSRAGGLGGAPQLTRRHSNTNPIPTRRTHTARAHTGLTHAHYLSTCNLHFWTVQ